MVRIKCSWIAISDLMYFCVLPPKRKKVYSYAPTILCHSGSAFKLKVLKLFKKKSLSLATYFRICQVLWLFWCRLADALTQRKWNRRCGRGEKRQMVGAWLYECIKLCTGIALFSHNIFLKICWSWMCKKLTIDFTFYLGLGTGEYSED